MKIALVQQNYHIGNFDKNTTSILNAVKKAKKGDEVGIKVDQKVHEGNEVYLVE